ncbi:uncharacterized protein LOC126732889 isoform X2 [Quercus robur]|uniref:uncharacterized protein LOC126732889 isoform X2 n=1 Tax=Quercus robur TaxID=38942 RepID=UPI002163A0D1|nr:uncharacterized protein LOC126732889 isoform X2 [Quercus robur]
MDPRYMGEILKHLEKQNELLMDSYRSMTHESHKLQVEEEMLMRKFFEIMTAHGLTKKSEDRSNVPDDAENGDSNAILIAQSEDRSNVSDDAKNGDSTAVVIATCKEQQ